MKVWDVLLTNSSTGGGGRFSSEGLFATEKLALAHVPKCIKWVEDYHGPYYPVSWEPPKLAADGPREWKATPYGERIKIVERYVEES